MKQAIIFLTHIFDQKTCQLFNKIQKDVKSLDVYIMTDRPDVIPFELRSRIIVFSSDDIEGARQQGVLDFDMDIARMKILYIFQKNKISIYYDYFWFIEYDVYYHGNWKDIFLINDSSDLVATHIHYYNENKYENQWKWWKSFSSPAPSAPYLTKAFLPLYRISKKGLIIIDKAVNSGWKGHFEVLLPTSIKYFGGTITDLGGNGPFTPIQRRGKFYRHYYPKIMDYIGTMRSTPHIFFFPQPHTLYHPFKNIKIRLKSLRLVPRIMYFYIYFFILFIFG